MKNFRQYDPTPADEDIFGGGAQVPADESCGTQVSPVAEENGPNPVPVAGIGMTEDAQKAPASTCARERMISVIDNTQKVNDAAKAVLDLINGNPELDAQFCMLFGIKPNGMDVH